MKRNSLAEKIPVGILYSVTGPYGVVSRSMLNASIIGLEECNEEANGSFELVPVFLDSGGRLDKYNANLNAMIHEHNCRHIIGCYTSEARKQLLPRLERSNALLWHSARYEGFEASENVIYVGAAPNQHILPLARYLIANMDPEVYCVGSNYIWTWESNRVLRDLVMAGGGKTVAQRLVPMGDCDIDHIIKEIMELRPPIVFNTLVGKSSYEFYRKLWRAISLTPGLSPGDINVVSCSLCEAELPLIGEPASIGHITSATYFQSIDRAENHSFLARYRNRFAGCTGPTVDAEAAYISARMLGRSIAECGSDAVEAVRNAACKINFEAPQGPVHIDSATNHCNLTPRLAVSSSGLSFDIFWQAAHSVRPDPYLAWQDDIMAYDMDALTPREKSNVIRLPLPNETT